MSPTATAEDVARRSYGKLVAFLAARTRDVAAAEDALSEAFAAALTDWPTKGVPTNPEAWILTVARRKAIDQARTRQRQEGLEFASSESAADIPDQRLALLFTCAHPAIEEAIRAPLMLQVVLGLDAKAVASAFLMSPAAMSKRLVRAKEKIRQAGIPFRVPEREELPGRLDAVLDAVYASFADAWTDPSGLPDEALFLARLLTELLPNEPEPLGLLALMLHAEARRHARRAENSDYIPLAQQNPALWNKQQIAEAESLLHRASQLGNIGRFQLEGALQSAHVHRVQTNTPNWPQVVQLYDALYALTQSPVVAINRALAIAETAGPGAALAILPTDPRLDQYQPYWAAKAALLARTGAKGEARQAYEIAIGLERDPAVRRFLQQRQSEIHD